MERAANLTRFQRLLPLISATLVFAVIASGAVVSQLRQRLAVEARLQEVSTLAEEAIRARSQSRIDSIDRMAARWETSGGTSESEWAADAARYITHQPELLALEWADRDYRVRWIVPMDGNEAASGLNLLFEENRAQALRNAVEHRENYVTPVLDLVQGGRGFLAFRPIFTPSPDGQGAEFDGLILAVVSLDRLIEEAVPQVYSADVSLVVRERGQQVYSNGIEAVGGLRNHAMIEVRGTRWDLEFGPSPQLMQAHRGWWTLAFVLLAAGLAVLTYITVGKLAQQAYIRRRAEAIQIEALEQSAASRRFLELVLDNIPDMIFVKDRDLKIVQANEPFLSLYPEDQRSSIIGTTTLEQYDPEERDLFTVEDRRTFAEGFSEVEESIDFPDGRRRILLTRKIRFVEADGAAYILGIARDISEEKKNESDLRELAESLRESEERFALAVRGSNDGIWDWNVRTNEVWYSPRFLELLGYQEGEFQHVFDSFAGALHPDDKERVLEAVQAHLRQSEEYDLNYRLLCKDGEYRWFRAAGIAKFEGGEPVRMAGAISDISSLVEAREAAEQSSRAKSGFLAHMSHELRTPLNGVLGMARSLRARPELSDEIVDQVDVITSSADALLQMLNDILDLSKIEAEKIDLETRPFSLNVFADRITSLYSNMAEDKGLQLEVKTDITGGDVRLGDRHRLCQIVDNLIANAIKFTDEGRVRLDLRADADRVEIVVEDTGIGLTDDQVAVIWEKFVQADESTTRRFGGTGLGLSIVRGLVQRMSGKVEVESEFGRGTRFVIELPLPPTSSSLIESAPGPGAVADAGSVLSGVRILAAEDNLTNRLVLKSFLDQTDAELTLVEDGAAAVDAYKAGQFDVLLMDMRMPVMGGVEALGKIRRWESEADRPRVPAIAFTADAMPEQVEEQKKAGFIAHLPKPLNPEQLVSTIGAATRGNRDVEARHSV